ncbi:MAG: ribulose-bisphosphate carboxylase large subunit [Candidatus Bathyarchaeia archaeon]
MMTNLEWYQEDFWVKVFTTSPDAVDPDENVICTYYIEPRTGMSLKDAGIYVAAEESIGTWTRVGTMQDYVLRYAAKVFETIEVGGGGIVKVAYPLDLFDLDAGISHMLSIIAGNLFGISAVDNIRLLDLELPREYAEVFRGPKFGIEGVRRLVGTDRKPRPHLGTIIKPKVGLTAKDFAKVAYEAAMGGVDFIKDDETLTSQKFNTVEDRITHVMNALDKVKSETGRNVLYACDITSDYNRLFKHAETVLEHGGNCVMVDVLCTGYAALRALAEDPSIKVPIHVHRALHAAMTRNPKHGIHMMVIAKLVRLAGGDQLHTGTAVGKMEKPRGPSDILDEWRGIRAIRRINDMLRSPWFHLKTILPVASGGIHPAIVPDNLEALGSPDIQVNAGGGIHGHPMGSRAGATAMMQAIEAYMNGITLEEYSKTHEELRIALEYWGYKFKAED